MSDCKTPTEYEETAFYYGRLEDSLCGIQRQKQKILSALVQMVGRLAPARSREETDIAYLDKLRKMGYSLEHRALLIKAREDGVKELDWHNSVLLETQQKVDYYEESDKKPEALTVRIINCCKARLLLHSVFFEDIDFNLETIDLLLRNF